MDLKTDAYSIFLFFFFFDFLQIDLKKKLSIASFADHPAYSQYRKEKV